jgi:hypothetical protein
MARTIQADQVVFYRALIEELIDGEWKAVKVFGPYYAPGSSRDHDGWYRVSEKYAAGTRRKRTQKQVVVTDGIDPSNAWIEWQDS